MKITITILAFFLLAIITYADEIPTFYINEVTSDNIEKSKMDLLLQVHPYESILLQKSYEVFDIKSKQENNVEIWKLLNGKSALEIFQYAIILHDKETRVQTTQNKSRLLKELQKLIICTDFPIEEKPAIETEISNTKLELHQLASLGNLLVTSDSYQFSKDEISTEKQRKRIKGKWNDLLVKALDQCDRFDIVSTNFMSTTPGEILHTITGSEKVKEFLNLAKIHEDELSHYCFCHGDALLVFYLLDKKVAEISYHHGLSLRWHNGPWLGDAKIEKSNQLALLKWFSVNGFDYFEKENTNTITQQGLEADPIIRGNFENEPHK